MKKLLTILIFTTLCLGFVSCKKGDEPNNPTEETVQDDPSPTPGGDSKTDSTSTTNMENGYLYVDLGLSVKWAAMNVGATSAEAYGKYFAWGETTSKSSYSWSNYKWCKGDYDSLTKYNTMSDFGTKDNRKTLLSADDAATAIWGGKWRMPTHKEWQELYSKCTWTWTTQNGKRGYKVTSKSTGNSIFLPAAGYYEDSQRYEAGSTGSYWSSSLNDDADNPDTYYAWSVEFESGEIDVNFGNDRSYGQTIRAVCP